MKKIVAYRYYWHGPKIWYRGKVSVSPLNISELVIRVTKSFCSADIIYGLSDLVSQNQNGEVLIRK